MFGEFGLVFSTCTVYSSSALYCYLHYIKYVCVWCICVCVCVGGGGVCGCVGVWVWVCVGVAFGRLKT